MCDSICNICSICYICSNIYNINNYQNVVMYCIIFVIYVNIGGHVWNIIWINVTVIAITYVMIYESIYSIYAKI